jgi:hypothetical protein
MSVKGRYWPWTWKRLRDSCEEVGTCWLWKGAVQGTGYPTASHEGKAVLMRRLVYTELMGKSATGMRIVTRCGNKLCLSEDCLVSKSRGDVLRRSYEDRVARNPLYLKRYQQIPGEIGIGKLDAEKATAIRESGRTAVEEAQRYGVHPETIREIRRGNTWKQIRVPGSSIFNLGA